MTWFEVFGVVVGFMAFAGVFCAIFAYIMAALQSVMNEFALTIVFLLVVARAFTTVIYFAPEHEPAEEPAKEQGVCNEAVL